MVVITCMLEPWTFILFKNCKIARVDSGEIFMYAQLKAWIWITNNLEQPLHIHIVVCVQKIVLKG